MKGNEFSKTLNAVFLIETMHVENVAHYFLLKRVFRLSGAIY
jgi:hypothetical protein